MDPVTRYTGSCTVQTNVINDAYNPFTGQTATAKVNGSDSDPKHLQQVIMNPHIY